MKLKWKPDKEGWVDLYVGKVKFEEWIAAYTVDKDHGVGQWLVVYPRRLRTSPKHDAVSALPDDRYPIDTPEKQLRKMIETKCIVLGLTRETH